MNMHRNIDAYLEMPPEERRHLRFNMRRKRGRNVLFLAKRGYCPTKIALQRR